jgi:mannose-1-phosphate guanylyltransferase/mannose-6-phosphate isomerase
MPLTEGASTFEQTLARINDPALFGRPVVVTNSEFRFLAAEQLQRSGVEADIVLEPVGRDSGPAIAVASELIHRRDPEACALILSADHLVRDVDGFRNSCRAALGSAEAGHIVTFGVKPTWAATSYGYIKPGAQIANSNTFLVDAFVEKPDAATAARYVAEGYLWNCGNFLFRTNVMLEEIARFEPEMRAATRSAIEGITRDLDFMRLPHEIFVRAPKKSIDYAVMERSSHVAVLPVEFGWSDIGSWGTLWQELERDEAGNSFEGPVVLSDTRNSLVRSDETILTTVVGCDNLVVVVTADAVLVIPKDQSEKVKDLVTTLRRDNRREASEHRRVYRPWGYYQGVDAGPRYQVKRIIVNPGSKLSLQKHHHRAEHWVVVKGAAEVTVNGDTKIAHENESVYLPIGSMHRLANPGKIPLELIEVQVGSYLGEDDIVRYEDVYNRS